MAQKKGIQNGSKSLPIDNLLVELAVTGPKTTKTDAPTGVKLKPKEFMSLWKLLKHPRTVSVATLATAIETGGVYTYDKYGRYMPFTRDTPEAQRALALLADIYEFESKYWESHDDVENAAGEAGGDNGQYYDISEGLHPLDIPDDHGDPYDDFGWAIDALPNFEAIRSGQHELPPKSLGGGGRLEKNYLHIIGALLECIAGKVPPAEKHPSFASEAQLIEFLDEKFDGIEGLSASNLQRKFPAAKHSIGSS